MISIKIFSFLSLIHFISAQIFTVKLAQIQLIGEPQDGSDSHDMEVNFILKCGNLIFDEDNYTSFDEREGLAMNKVYNFNSKGQIKLLQNVKINCQQNSNLEINFTEIDYTNDDEFNPFNITWDQLSMFIKSSTFHVFLLHKYDKSIFNTEEKESTIIQNYTTRLCLPPYDFENIIDNNIEKEAVEISGYNQDEYPELKASLAELSTYVNSIKVADEIETIQNSNKAYIVISNVNITTDQFLELFQKIKDLVQVSEKNNELKNQLTQGTEIKNEILIFLASKVSSITKISQLYQSKAFAICNYEKEFSQITQSLQNYNAAQSDDGVTIFGVTFQIENIQNSYQEQPSQSKKEQFNAIYAFLKYIYEKPINDVLPPPNKNDTLPPSNKNDTLPPPNIDDNTLPPPDKNDTLPPPNKNDTLLSPNIDDGDSRIYQIPIQTTPKESNSKTGEISKRIQFKDWRNYWVDNRWISHINRRYHSRCANKKIYIKKKAEVIIISKRSSKNYHRVKCFFTK